MKYYESREQTYEFLCEREKNPPTFCYTDLSDLHSSNPLTYISEDGGLAICADLNVCIGNSRTLKSEFQSVKFPELTNCKVFWYRKGHNDEEEWYLIGRYDYFQPLNGLTQHCYFFMTAWCDNTGFDCRGEIQFYLAQTLQGLCQYGITDAVRQLILKD